MLHVIVQIVEPFFDGPFPLNEYLGNVLLRQELEETPHEQMRVP